MAILRAFGPVNLQAYEIAAGSLLLATETLVREARGPLTIDYAGAFALGPGGPSGIVTDMTVWQGESALYEVAGVGLDIAAIRTTLDAGDLFPFFRALFEGDDVLEGSPGGDVLDGLGGSDFISGMAGADELWGFAGDDTIIGGPGTDRLEGEAGSDILIGGTGIDTATYAGGSEGYALEIAAGSGSVRDKAAPVDVDVLQQIERIYFSGDAPALAEEVAYELGDLTGIAALTPDEIVALVEMYVAYFDRAPDAFGLHFWGSALAGGATMQEIATLFFQQEETRAAFPDPEDSAALVDTAYRNVLEREADAVGRAWWIDALDSGAVSRGAFMLELLDGARANPQATGDVRTIEDKGDIGLAYAGVHGLTDIGNATAVMEAYDRADRDVSLAAAEALINAFAADARAGAEFTMPLIGIVEDPFA